MARLEDLVEGTSVAGLNPREPVTVIHVKWFGGHAIELTYKNEQTVTAVKASAPFTTGHD